jgi:tetratricopeptide (TPR) repeat protein
LGSGTGVVEWLFELTAELSALLNIKSYPNYHTSQYDYLLESSRRLVSQLILEQEEKNNKDYDNHYIFLISLLQSVVSDEINLVTLLEKNLTFLNGNLIEVLEDWANYEAIKYERSLVLTALYKLSNIIFRFLKGDRSINIDLAITLNELALKFLNSSEYTETHTAIEYELGIMNSERTRGDKNENLEMAIVHHKLALEVYTQINFPTEWAEIQYKIALAYGRKNISNEGTNLEIAISHYEHALEVYTKIDFPEKWAAIQFDLGVVYTDRIQGPQESNLEVAVKHYECALEVYTQTDFPVAWATICYNLSSLYYKKTSGDISENLENAIRYGKEALKIRNEIDFPLDWAASQHNLGLIYRERIEGRKEDNLEVAITSYKLALFYYNKIERKISLFNGRQLNVTLLLLISIELWMTKLRIWRSQLLAVKRHLGFIPKKISQQIG